MIEEKASVVAKNSSYVWVEAEHRSSCEGCTVNKGCGTGAVARYLGRRPARIRASNPIGAEVGDEVIVGLPESALLRGSGVLYMLPLFVMFLGAGLGEILTHYFDGGESLVIGLGFGGLTVGFSGARYIIDRLPAKGNFEPRILRFVPKKVMNMQPIYFIE